MIPFAGWDGARKENIIVSPTNGRLFLTEIMSECLGTNYFLGLFLRVEGLRMESGKLPFHDTP